jgi:hypothetical protein
MWRESMAETAPKQRLYKLAARELSMTERPEYVRNAVDVVLDDLFSYLLGELPEEAVEAAWGAYSHPDEDEGEAVEISQMKYAVVAAVASLRDSLVSGRGETNDA